MREQEAIKIIESELAFEPIDRDKEALKVAVKALKEIQQYRAIGTVQQCKEAVEKQKPTKPYYVELDEPLCPYCHSVLEYSDICECGQRIDRS